MRIVSHLLDHGPTGIHASASRCFPLPLIVVTIENHAVWAVTDGAIEYLQQSETDAVSDAEV